MCIRDRVKRLLADSEVQKKSGIYPYLLTGKEKHLNIRQFDSDVAPVSYTHLDVYKRQAQYNAERAAARRGRRRVS